MIIKFHDSMITSSAFSLISGLEVPADITDLAIALFSGGPPAQLEPNSGHCGAGD